MGIIISPTPALATNEYSLLAIVQEFTQRKGLPIPTSVVGSNSAQVNQILAIIHAVVRKLAVDYLWEVATKEATFVTVALETQGNINTIAPDGFLNIIQATIFNRTLRLPVFGPVGPRPWQGLKALPAVGPFYKYRLRGNSILFNPVPSAGHSCYFEYQSSWLVGDSTRTPKGPRFLLDTDTFLLEPEILRLGLEYRWRYETGLPYAEEFQDFQTMAADMAGRDATKPVLSMDDDSRDWRPGIFVPSGNWPIS